jgi:hypothetical protein
MPEDAVEISEARYLEVIGNPARDKIRSHDDDGLPILIDAPVDDPSFAERTWRDAEISRIQWIRDRHRDEQDSGLETTLDTERFKELLDYMQRLRDWPAAQGFPDSIGRPIPPAWSNDQIK